MAAVSTQLDPEEIAYQENAAAAEEDLLDDSELWFPEQELITDLDEPFKQKKLLGRIPAVLPSQFTEFAFRMPGDDGLGYVPFSFEGRRHMRQPYDTPARRILLFCARQVEKSTLLGNKMIAYSCLVAGYRSLYVSPSATQTKTFSHDRIKDPLETSHVLKSFTTSVLQQNVFEKQFINRSKITLRYAFLNADRTRGIPAWGLCVDELQDILGDNIPIIEQCTSHAPEAWKRYIYAGTPKSLDNVIEYYRSNLSTQGEWVVPCDAHGGETGRYWNVLGEKNIGLKGLSCEKCGGLINPAHPDAQWANMVRYDPQRTPFESYRIPQLMVPWKSWDEILLDYRRYPRDKFYNEVLGISFDSGMRPLTTAQVQECSHPKVTMDPDMLKKYRALAHGHPIYAGLDWGTGEHSFTVLVLGMYVGTKFRVFYAHRFEGEETDPVVQLNIIVQMLKDFNVRVIGADYGGGFHSNDRLVREFGTQRVHKYQYMAKTKKKVNWNPNYKRWMVHRTEVMSDVFNAIKRNQIEFPRWEEWREPFAQDMLNIFSEYNETLRMIQYSHGPDKPDDTFHAVLYCLLASMIMQPRPDIISPNREDGTRGPLFSNYSGPTNQG